MALTVSELIAQRAELDKQITEMQRADRQQALEKIRAMMGESGLTLADLTARVASQVGGKAESSAGKGSEIAPKYRDATTGNTWSGRGLKPRWLKTALDNGANLADFAV